MDLHGKCVLLGVSGGIAAYKMANVASALKKLGADVEVIMTLSLIHIFVVQQQQVVPAGRFPTKVVDAREVEALFRVGDCLLYTSRCV